MISQEYLKSILHYNPETGIFTWRVRRRRGKVAGTICNGYIHIGIDGKQYKAHRLVFLYMTGEFPPDMCDHINCIRDDNRFSNLRHCTNAQNQRNSKKPKTNKSGFKGVFWLKKDRKWRAQIKLKGVSKNIGRFDCKKKAAAQYNKYALKNFGEFARLNEIN